MKRIATILCLAQLLTMSTSIASEKRIIAWKVANVGNNIITNIDVENYIEHTQITDSLKTILFKKAEKNYSKYLDLKRELTQKSFKKATGQLVYAQIMKADHQRKHGRKRVAFRTTEKSFYNAIEENESRVLKSLLDQRMGIVKARKEFGQFLINQGYPHIASESSTDVYMRWYNDQKDRIKTEFLLKEVKNYEAYLALRNEKYFMLNYSDLQDKYESLKEEVKENINNKKISHKSLLGLVNANPDWTIVIKELSNTQIETASVDSYKDDLHLQARADEILFDITQKEWNKTVGYHSKISELIEKKYTIAELNSMAKNYTEAYIADKSKYSSYMMGLIAKLAARTLESSSIEEVNSLARELNIKLRKELASLKRNITKSSSKSTLDRVLEKDLLAAVNYEELSELEKSLVELSIFSIKFQVKKHSFENTMPVRVDFQEYTSLKTQDGLRNHFKREWMKKEFKTYIQREMIWSLEYMTIRTGGNEYLTPDEKTGLVFGKDFL